MLKSDPSPSEQKINKVVKMHDDDLKYLSEAMKSKLAVVNTNIFETEMLLKELEYEIPKATDDRRYFGRTNTTPIVVDEWDTIVDKAENRYTETVSIEDVFTKEELSSNHAYMLSLQEQFKDLNKLDKFDYATAGIVGTIAALMDFFLVTKVNLKDGTVTPGSLKSGVENLWDKILTPKEVARLESKYKVPFDISTNTSKISQEVLGLTPKTHRFQSLGHDAILGFIFGVKDLMNAELTAIDGNGRLIIQNVSGAKGKGFIDAVITEIGHLFSDVNATSKKGMKLSIPAPFTPLFQLIQVGNVSYKGKIYTIGDLSKRMYYDGFNFNHFIGMGIPVALIHIVIRLYVVLREMFSDEYVRTKHKSDILLFVANSILFGENVGKLIVNKNPFAINYVSWIDTARYAIRTLKYVVIDYHVEQVDYIQKIIDGEVADTYETVLRTWDRVCVDRTVIYR